MIDRRNTLKVPNLRPGTPVVLESHPHVERQLAPPGMGYLVLQPGMESLTWAVPDGLWGNSLVVLLHCRGPGVDLDPYSWAEKHIPERSGPCYGS